MTLRSYKLKQSKKTLQQQPARLYRGLGVMKGQDRQSSISIISLTIDKHNLETARN